MSLDQMRTKLIAELAQCDVNRYYFDPIVLIEMFDKIESSRDRLEFWKFHCIFFMTWPYTNSNSPMQLYCVNSLFYSLKEYEWSKETSKILRGHIKHLDKLRCELQRDASSEYWIHEKGEDSPCT